MPPPGPVLQDPEELLYRQVHPSWIQAGRPTSQAFRPTSKDEGLLSVSRGACTTAEQAFRLHTEEKKLHSAGVWSVVVADCTSAGRVVYADPITHPVDDAAHAVVDFTGLSAAKAQAVAGVLKAKAVCQYAAQRAE
jgi:hypothetical protein